MSWLFSRALVEESSAGICLDGAACALWSETPTPQACSWLGRTTGASRLSRSGMTCAPLTAGHGEALLTWCLADSRARTSASQEEVQASTARAPASGGTWPASLARYDLASSSWRTHQRSLVEGLDEFSATWPRWGTMRGGEFSALTMPAHVTSAIGSGSSLWQDVDSLPTPTVCGNYNRKGASKTSGDGLATVAHRLPTPAVNDSKNTQPLDAVVGGPLNPPWVEWVMGWPIGWTALEPLETGRFRQWLDSHGGR